MTSPDEAAPPSATTVPAESQGPIEPTAPALRPGASPTRPGRWLLRAMVALAVGVLAVIGSWLLLRTGVQADTWPPFLPDAGPSTITRYSGPWITAAAAALLVAGLLLLLGSVDLVRYRRSARLSE